MGLVKLFLMHVTTVSDAIKKCGHLDDYEKAVWKYRKAKEAIKSARAGLLLLGESMRKSRKKRKRPRKARRWLQQRQRFMCPKPRILFFYSRVLRFRSDPSRMKYWLLQD
jgi:hypothetical protein